MKIIIVLEVKQVSDNNYHYITPNQLATIENNSCTEVHITCLDYIPESLRFIGECIAKLRKNGILTLVGLDIVEISKAVITGQITIDDINAILYKGKQSIDTLNRLKLFLASIHTTIEDIRLNNLTYNIKAIKND